MKIETKCVQSGYQPENGAPRVLPIYQSTTYKYDSSEHVGKLFDLTAEGHMYTRISNPTLAAVEEKIADLEGGVGALLTSSGQSAILIAVSNLCNEGDHLICSSAIYGGAINLLSVTMRRMGLQVTFVDPTVSAEALEKEIKPNTKAIFGETIANPALEVLDIEMFAKVAHKHHIPLIVDNTFATPILCRPFEYGADIVLHSTSKYMDGHAVALGGVIVDSGKFDWTSGKFPQFTEPDDSYHGIVYAKDFKNVAYIVKARVQLMRDLGVAMSPHTAFLLNLGLETLHLRMERHSANALAVASYLEQHPKIEWVHYPKLPSDHGYALGQKYLPKGASGVISFGVKGGRECCVQFMDALKLANIVVHVADARTSVLHPASTTHRQLSSAQLVQAGISENLIRMSIGIENIDDIIEDIQRALASI